MFSLQSSHLEKDTICKSIQIDNKQLQLEKNQTNGRTIHCNLVTRETTNGSENPVSYNASGHAFFLIAVPCMHDFDCCWKLMAALKRPLLWITTAALAALSDLHAHREYRQNDQD